MKKRILIALGIIILAAGIGAGGWYYYSHHMGTVSGSDTVYVTKISKLSFRCGESLCRRGGTAGNCAGKDRERAKSKRSTGKDR